MTSISKEVRLDAAAVEYASAGRVVFPVGGADGKRPLVKWSALESGERHVRRVSGWWHPLSLWREASIGLRTGNGLVVIDVDPRHGGKVDLAWPATLAASTPSGGVHLFYSSTAPVRCSAGVVAPGVDVRGEGGYVVVPPAPGREWVHEVPISALPVLPCRGGRSRGAAHGLPDGWRPFEPADVVEEGGRNAYLARVAGWLASQGVGEMDAENLLQDYNTAACRPPLDRDEVASVAASIARYHRARPDGSRR